MLSSYRSQAAFIFLALLSYLSLATVQLTHFADDPGVGWHLATGLWIIENAALPTFDPFLASEQLRPWVSDQWASDLVLYALYYLGSWPLLYTVLLLIYFLTFWLLLAAKLSKLTDNLLAIALICFFAAKLSQVHFILRPVLFSFPFLILARSLLDNICTRSAVRLCLVSFLLFMFWSWFHPSFPIGLLVLGCGIVGNTVDWMRSRQSVGIAVKSVLSFIAALLGTLLNPYGTDLHSSILYLATNKYFMNLHEEWLPPELFSPEGQALLLSLTIIAIALLLKPKLIKELATRELILLCVFAYLAFTANRMLPIWAIVGAWSLLPFVLVILERMKSYSVLLKRICAARACVPVRELLIIVVGTLAYCALFDRPPLYSGSFGPCSDRYPYSVVRTLNDRIRPPLPATVVASPDWGGFITFLADGRLKAVIDDRNTLIGEEFYRNFFQRMQPESQVKEYLDQLGARYLLLSANSKLAEYLLAQGLAKEIVRDDLGWALEMKH